MNSFERALYDDLSTILREERMPDGRPLEPREWWLVLHVAETIGTGGALGAWAKRAHHIDGAGLAHPHVGPGAS